MVAAKIKVVDPVDVVEPWVEAEVEVVKAVVDGDVRGWLHVDDALLPVAVMNEYMLNLRQSSAQKQRLSQVLYHKPFKSFF